MAKYKTKKIGNVNAVHINDLGLKYGKISPNNSVPYINADYADRLIAMDQGIGEPYIITSAMGGQHAGGPRGHGAGVKLDLVGSQPGGKFSTRAQDFINKNFIGNGAIGWHDAGTGFHNDITLLGANGMQNNPVLRQAPGLINSQPDIINLQQGGLLNNARTADYYDQLRAAALAKYDIAKAQQNAGQNIDEATNQAVKDINEQVALGVDDPIVLQHMNDLMAAKNLVAQDRANKMADYALGEYINQRTPEQMGDEYRRQIQQFLDMYNAQNPYNQVAGQVTPYNVDPQALERARQGQQFHNRAMQNLALSAVASGDVNTANLLMQQANANYEQDLLKQAQQQYTLQVANQLGIPPELVQAQMEHNNKMAEQMASPGATAIKEATITQPETTRRTLIENLPKNEENVFKDAVIANQNAYDNRLDMNKLYQTGNLVGAKAQAQSLADKTGMYAKYPQQVLDKANIELSNIGKEATPLIQGTTGMTNSAIEAIQKNAKGINDNQTDIYTEQGKDLREAFKAVKQANETTGGGLTPDKQLKLAKDKQSLVNSLLARLIDPATGYPAEGTQKQFAQVLNSSGQFTADEVENYLDMYYKK